MIIIESVKVLDNTPEFQLFPIEISYVQNGQKFVRLTSAKEILDLLNHAKHKEWRAGLPTEEGWYWILCDDGEKIISKVSKYNNSLFIMSNDKYEEMKLEDARYVKYWIGPLQEVSELEKMVNNGYNY